MMPICFAFVVFVFFSEKKPVGHFSGHLHSLVGFRLVLPKVNYPPIFGLIQLEMAYDFPE